MNLTATLAAALDLSGDGRLDGASSVSVRTGEIGVCVLDAEQRRALADDLGADKGALDGTGASVTHRGVLTADDGEVEVRIFGAPDAVDWRHYRDVEAAANIAAAAS